MLSMINRANSQIQQSLYTLLSLRTKKFCQYKAMTANDYLYKVFTSMLDPWSTYT